MGTNEVRLRYLDFFKKRGHEIIPSSSLIPENDPTTLFNSSGMQPLLPYFLGKPHPLGTKIADSQECFRAQDIEEVGDNRHTTFFEMLGNWSFGDYFKEEQLSWIFEFLTDKKIGLGLNPQRIYVTVFGGDKQYKVKDNDHFQKLSPDSEAVNIWKRLFKSAGIEAKDIDNAKRTGMQGGRIFYYSAEKNWWSRNGVPQNMPVGEPGGPDSEIFYDFGEELKLHEQSQFKNLPCHVNCDCGRFLEIGNSVFMMYRKINEETFEELPQKNIDFGGGLERLAAATENQPDIFQIDSFAPIIAKLEEETDKSYKEIKNKPAMRVIADHLKASTFLITDGIKPSNKGQGYILRRLLRRSAVKMHNLTGATAVIPVFQDICRQVIKVYQGVYFNDSSIENLLNQVINQELNQFSRVLDKGLKQLKKQPPEKINAKFVFDLYQSYGFPFEITQEILAQQGQQLDKNEFISEVEKHKNLSRRSAEQKFSGLPRQ